MSTAQTILRLSAVLIAAVLALPATALELASDKDDLFGYPAILSQADGGAFITIDYQKKRDLFGRDEIPQRRVKGKYVSLGITWSQHFETLENAGRKIDVFRAGKLKSAKFAVIFVHGRGGDRKLGANDYTFGGNFNRLKNLAADNSGVYFAPTARDFEDQGTGDISALIGLIHQTNPDTRIILSCASMGTLICWRITQDATTVSQLSGMMIMAGVPNPDFIKSAAHEAKLPMFFSHGSDDPVYAAADQIKLYKLLFAEQYPTRFVLFQTGNHGTPIRMTDWRDTLNWFFSTSR